MAPVATTPSGRWFQDALGRLNAVVASGAERFTSSWPGGCSTSATRPSCRDRRAAPGRRARVTRFPVRAPREVRRSTAGAAMLLAPLTAVPPADPARPRAPARRGLAPPGLSGRRTRSRRDRVAVPPAAPRRAGRHRGRARGVVRPGPGPRRHAAQRHRPDRGRHPRRRRCWSRSRPSEPCCRRGRRVRARGRGPPAPAARPFAPACRRGVPAARPEGLGATVAGSVGVAAAVSSGAVVAVGAGPPLIAHAAWLAGALVVVVSAGTALAVVAHRAPPRRRDHRRRPRRPRRGRPGFGAHRRRAARGVLAPLRPGHVAGHVAGHRPAVMSLQGARAPTTAT